MGRRRKKVEQREVELEWPFEIGLDILKRIYPKVAFLSGCPREYYPDDPGFSKFGITFCLPDAEDKVNPSYYPSDDRLDKPVSLLGYGIGGLLGPRFPKDIHSESPAPNAYQDHLLPARVKRDEKVEKPKWRDFVEKYERIAQQQFDEQEGGDKSSKRQPDPNISQDTSYPPSTSRRIDEKSELEFKSDVPCPKKQLAAFEISINNPRFDTKSDPQFPGAGTYETSNYKKKQSYQITTPDGKFIPRVRMVCMPTGADTCMNCGEEQLTTDYYQTKKLFKVLNKVDPSTHGKYKLTHLNLCRECYCQATKFGRPPWNKQRIPDLFMKARNCNSIHDHQEGHDNFYAKSTCKLQLKLARKEVLFARYFKDRPCPRSNPYRSEAN